MRNRWRTLLTLGLLVPLPALADTVDDFARAQMARSHIPAMAIVVVQEGTVRKMAAYGTADLDWDGAATPHTAFQIASGTKAFTGTLLMKMVRQGKLKGLAITTRTRSALVPNIPTVAESGVPGFEGITWLGLAAPAKTPGPIIERLGAELKAVLGDKDVIAKLAATGAEPPGAPGPEGMRALLAEDIARWKAILSDGKIKLQ